MKRRTEFNVLRIRMLLVFMLCLPVSAGCVGPRYWDGYTGKVVDAETGEPLEGVFVIARYWGDYMYIADFQTACYHATGTTTNAQGEYRMSPHFDAPDIKVDKRSDVDFFKPGYRHVFYKDGIAKLEKDQGTREEQFIELVRMARNRSCDGAGESQRSLYPLYEAIYYEAASISVTNEEKKKLEWFRWVAASQAIARDGDQGMGSTEFNRLIDEYLKDHLQ